jgi:hypothetical protein
MSKEPKKPNKEQPTKIDMSFEDAIRLAMKTKPLMTLPLVLNEKIELKGVSGTTVAVTSIEVDINDNASNYKVDFDIVSTIGKGVVSNTMATSSNATPNKNVREITFNNRLTIPDGCLLYFTLKAIDNKSISKTAKITYSIATI